MFGADTKALYAKHCLYISPSLLKQIFPEGQKLIFSLQLIKATFHKIIFILVFVTSHLISRQLLMDIIFGYPLTGQFHTI